MRTLLLVAALAAAAPVAAQPISSDLADARAGGGCYPTALAPSVLDMLVLINPEWAPIVNGQTVDSDPVPVSGTVESMHGQTSGDFPSTHLFSDVVMDVRVDPEHANKVATGNGEPDIIAFEWEVGAFPEWAWPGFGDRIYGLGRHIFDCGHPDATAGHCSVTTATACVLDPDCPAGETCEGEHFGYSSEIHPPHATAVIRQGRGAVLSKNASAKPVPATIADVWVSGFGGHLVAGWNDKHASLTHVRVTVSAILVENDLMRATPVVPRTCSTADTPCATDGDCPAGESCFGEGPVEGWAAQSAANGEWRRFNGAALDRVGDGDVIAQST